VKKQTICLRTTMTLVAEETGGQSLAVLVRAAADSLEQGDHVDRALAGQAGELLTSRKWNCCQAGDEQKERRDWMVENVAHSADNE
jgi:hypothetical protein